MDKTENFENNKYYIVSLDNGIREEEPVEMNVISEFSDGSKLVQLNKTVFGLFKENNDPNSDHIDDYEIIKSDIAELLDIEHEESRRIVDEEKNIGVFTNLNYRKDIETRVSATTMFNHIISLMKQGALNDEKAQKIISLLSNPRSSKNQPLKDEDTIADIINEGMDALLIGIATQSNSTYTSAQEKTLRKNYIRMILFDIIIGRKNRGLDYHIICPIDDQKIISFKDARLSPITIYSNQTKENKIPNDTYYINNEYIDVESLISTLYNKFYSEIKKIVTALNDVKRLYQDAISRIIYNNIDIKSAETLEIKILKNYDSIIKTQQELERQQDKVYKENKVERTMATQSLNVKVTTKLDLIQKKYPINPKTTLSEVEPDKDKKVKLVVETEKESKEGFINSAILVSTVAFVCGVISGITYILLTFGS